jgi:hypothetical protein
MVKLRKRSVIIIAILAILIIAAGSYLWWINSPKYGLGVTNVKIYSITETTERWVHGPYTEEQEIEIEAWRKKENARIDEYRRTHPKASFADILEQWGSPWPPNLRYVGHTEYDTATTGKGIRGELINRANREFSNIDVEFAIYNTPDNQIGEFSIHVDNLQPHKTYRFDEVLDKDLFDRGASSCTVISITTE